MASTSTIPVPDFGTHVQTVIHEQLQEHAPDSVLCRGFEVLSPHYTSVLRRFAGRFLAAAEADELVQECWVRALVNMARVLPSPLMGEGSGVRADLPDSLRSWLCTVLRNCALNMLRAKKRHPVELGRERELDAVVDPHPGPEDELEALWERERAASLLPMLKEKLPEKEYRLLELRYVEGHSPTEMARRLGLQPAQVSYRLYRLLKKLRKLLGVYYGEKSGTAPRSGNHKKRQ